jgi:hypothetical protein
MNPPDLSMFSFTWRKSSMWLEAMFRIATLIAKCGDYFTGYVPSFPLVDIVLGADVIYTLDHPLPLAAAVDAHLRPGGVLILTAKNIRPGISMFFEDLKVFPVSKPLELSELYLLAHTFLCRYGLVLQNLLYLLKLQQPV